MKVRNNLRYFFLSLLLSGFLIAVNGQQSQTLYFMRLPQSNFMNPALTPACGVYIDFPVIGSTDFTVRNNSLTFSDIIFPGTGASADSLITILHPDYNIDDFLAKLNNNNLFSADVNTNLFSLGFRVGKSMIHFNIFEKVETSIGIPGDLLTLLFKGNESFVGNQANLNPLSFDLSWYRSYGLGISQEVFPGFRVGFRGHLLAGMANVSLKNSDLSLNVDETDFSHKLGADLSLNISGPVTFVKDSAGNIQDVRIQDGIDQPSFFVPYLLSFKNPGFAGDFGVEYTFMDKIKLSASIVDLGFIYWQRDVSNLVSKGEFTFNGIDASPAFNVNDTNTIDDVVNSLLDSLQQIFTPVEQSTAYFTSLNPKIYVGGSYSFAEHFSLGILSRTEIANKKLLQSFTFSANAGLGRFLTTSISYTLANNSYKNIGAGLSLRGGPFQLYVLTDYGLGALYPDETKALNVWFGLNFTFGCKPRLMSDPPMIL
ncbi:MAG: hypothetical protein GXO83_12670 [Chlorobi bacterium]|nr:hypothetical protein [Chlorobiota bacterium]